MTGQHPAFIATLASQFGSISAVLGGFASTYLAALLAIGQRGRASAYAIAGAVISSASFMVAVVASLILAAIYHPEAPRLVRPLPLTPGRIVMTLAVIVGRRASFQPRRQRLDALAADRSLHHRNRDDRSVDDRMASYRLPLIRTGG